jgi:hypothetical protein
VDDARAVAVDGHAAWSELFNEMFMQVAGAFSNARVRRHGRSYVLGLLSQAERKNSWQLAEFAGDASPDGMQRLLNFSPWDEDAARDALARYVVRSMGDPGDAGPHGQMSFPRHASLITADKCKLTREARETEEHDDGTGHRRGCSITRRLHRRP